MQHHPQNTNLSLWSDPYFEELKVNLNHGPLIYDYLKLTKHFLTKVTHQVPRLICIRVDLHLPKGSAAANPIEADMPSLISENSSDEITRFIRSLNYLTRMTLLRLRKKGKHYPESPCRYIWAKEQDHSELPHYHLALFFNRDSFRPVIGDYQCLSKDTFASRIVRAWASALKMEPEDVRHLVHFPDNPLVLLSRPSRYCPERHRLFVSSFQKIFYRLSYFAKARSKQYGFKGRSLGYSRC